MRLHQIILDYFSFSRGERHGIIVLIALIGFTLLAQFLLPFFEHPEQVDPGQTEMLNQKIYELQENEKLKSVLFPFNPNLISKETLDSLRLPERVKHNLLRYRAGGGHFYRIQDFRKIYGMNDSIFANVKSFIRLPRLVVPKVMSGRPPLIIGKLSGGNRQEHSAPFKRKKKDSVVFELNSVTADQLRWLPGIGPVLSVRIIKYRNLLGGFTSVSQLGEVYGLSPEVLAKIHRYLTVNCKLIDKHNVNLENVRELAGHPYLKWKDAVKIVDYRTKHGYIENLLLLKQDSVLDERVWRKISPYLKAGN